MKRTVLQQARKDKGMTQQEVAEYLGISLRYYQDLELGAMTGSVSIWDALEDLFLVNQRTLRAVSDTSHVQASSQ